MVKKLRPKNRNKGNRKKLRNMQERQKTLPRAIGTPPMASHFQETTKMALRHHQGYTFLHVIDMYTCFSAANCLSVSNRN